MFVNFSMAKKSLFKEVLKRRVPQIIGSYIIAATSLVLFLDWLSTRYDYPESYISLALFGIISIIPSVIILAYFHGTPGKDAWTKMEKIGIPVNILFIAVILVVFDFTDNTKEPLDSYFLHFTSTENYIDGLYKYESKKGRKLLPFIVDSINTPISSIEDTMLYNITGDCFGYLTQQFQNKGTEIFSNFKESHTSIMDNFPFPTIIDTSGGGSWYPYPIQQFSQIFNVDENNIPKVFMQILIYKTKNYNTGNEKLFKEVWWKIKREDNLSWRKAQFYDNNESGYKNLIKDLKEELLADINRLRFSSNPFFEWVGEIEEILPNNKIKIKYIYESNSIKNNLLLDVQTMYSHSVDGACKEEICIVGIKELLDDIQLGITYIEENKSTVPDSLFEEIYKLKQDFTRYEKLLDSLIQNDIHAPEHNWLSEPFYTVKVLEVFGDYAVAKLHTKNKPWAKIKVGHKLSIHK